MRLLKRKSLDKVKISYSSDEQKKLKRWILEGIEYATGRRKIEKLYNQLPLKPFDAKELWGFALQGLAIELLYDQQQIQKIPKEGPVVIIANHPFGVVDGLILAFLAAQVRNQFVVIVNEVLCRNPLLAPYLLPVDFRETKEALETNLQTRKRALERLSAGEILAVFPAGGVATSPRIWGKAEDLEWKRFVAKLIQQTEATVVPMYFDGQNSRIFQVASQFSASLRLSLLLNEVRNKMGRQIYVRIGDPIPFQQLASIKNRQDLLDHIRSITFNLAVNQEQSFSLNNSLKARLRRRKQVVFPKK